MGEKEHDGRHKGRLRRKAYVTGLSLAKATGGSWLKKWKATVTPDPNRPLRGNGSELDSPRDMFLGLSLRFKIVLRNSGRIYLATARMETSPRSSSTTERARLPHWNEATCGFRSPALVGRIDFGEIELRGKRPDSVPLLADCSFRLLRTKLFSAAKDFVLLVYSLLPSCFALETANAVPHNKEGFFPTSTHLFIT